MADSKVAQEFKADVQKEEERVSAAEIETQLSQLREDVGGLMSALSSYGGQKADGYRRKVGELADGAKSELSAWESDLEASIRRKPLHAIGIAAGIGFVAALLTRR